MDHLSLVDASLHVHLRAISMKATRSFTHGTIVYDQSSHTLAFGKLPAGTVDTLVKPENKATLTKILTYHVVAGRISSKQIEKMIKKGNGTATLTTVEGGTLKASMSGSSIVLTDEKGGTATITTPDVFQSNGVIHVIDTVLMPK